MRIEIIADGIHVPADLLHLLIKIKGINNISLVTDSMRAAGMPEGRVCWEALRTVRKS